MEYQAVRDTESMPYCSGSELIAKDYWQIL